MKSAFCVLKPLFYSPHTNYTSDGVYSISKILYHTEDGKKRIPQLEFWQTKSWANSATRYRADVITLKVGRFAKVFYRQVFLPYSSSVAEVKLYACLYVHLILDDGFQ